MTEYYLLTLLQWLPLVWVFSFIISIFSFMFMPESDLARWRYIPTILFLVMTLVTFFAPSVHDYARYLSDNPDTKPGVRARAKEILDREMYRYKRDKELLEK